jgi:hypothetical protein
MPSECRRLTSPAAASVSCTSSSCPHLRAPRRSFPAHRLGAVGGHFEESSWPCESSPAPELRVTPSAEHNCSRSSEHRLSAVVRARGSGFSVPVSRRRRAAPLLLSRCGSVTGCGAAYRPVRVGRPRWGSGGRLPQCQGARRLDHLRVARFAATCVGGPRVDGLTGVKREAQSRRHERCHERNEHGDAPYYRYDWPGCD